MTTSRTGAAGGARGTYCGHCGGPCVPWTDGGGNADDGGTAAPSPAHRQCLSSLQWEPPRFCVQCGRRLKVQVTPLGWRTECSRHGPTTAP